MKCPFCGTDEDKVIDSRPARDGRATRRRRECTSCGRRYTTYEAPDENLIMVLKSDGTREPFIRQKVYRGISIACNKRPVPSERIEDMTAGVEARVLAAGREVSSTEVGNWILEELVVLDEVAYIRFASVFKRYESLEEFFDEVTRLRNELNLPSQVN